MIVNVRSFFAKWLVMRNARFWMMPNQLFKMEASVILLARTITTFHCWKASHYWYLAIIFRINVPQRFSTEANFTMICHKARRIVETVPPISSNCFYRRFNSSSLLFDFFCQYLTTTYLVCQIIKRENYINHWMCHFLMCVCHCRT